MSNERTLVSNARAGDAEPLPGKASRPSGPPQWDELASLYKSLEPCLRWRAQSLLHDVEDAKEVVQETFTAFMRAHPSLRGEASHSTVLHGILIRQAVNRMRKRSRGAVRTNSRDREDEAGTSSPRDADIAHDGDLGRVEALGELAVLTRDESAQTLSVAYRYLLEECTFEEIGQELGLSRRVVSQALQQFVERMRRRRAHSKASSTPS